MANTQHFVGPNPSPFARKNPQTLPRARLLHGLLDCLHGGELFVHLLLLNRGENKGELEFWGPVRSNTWDCLLPKPCETMEVWLPKAFQPGHQHVSISWYHCALMIWSYSSHLHRRATPVHSSPNCLTFWSYFPMACWLVIGSCLHTPHLHAIAIKSKGFWQYRGNSD